MFETLQHFFWHKIKKIIDVFKNSLNIIHPLTGQNSTMNMIIKLIINKKKVHWVQIISCTQ